MYINPANPELSRNIWQEFTLSRLIVMPIILAILFIAMLAIGGVYHLSIILFTILANIYGTKLATESIVSELNERTWDNQRLTLSSPLSMAIGKLFGSTAFAWYGALITLFVYFIAAISEDNFITSLRFGIWSLFFALFIQVSAMILATMGLRKNRTKHKISWFFYFLIAVAISWEVRAIVSAFYFSNMNESLLHIDTIYWYFIGFDAIDFAIGGTIIFVLWAIYGLKNLIRLEFNFRNKSTAWIAFLIFLTVFFLGFNFGIKEMSNELLTISRNLPIFSFNSVIIPYIFFAPVLISLNYYLIFSEKHSVIKYKKILQLYKEHNFKELSYITPLWLTTCIFVSIVTILMQIISLVYFSFAPDANGLAGLFLPISILLFLFRDFAIVLFFNFSGSIKRPEIGALITFFILNFVIPIIVAVTINPAAVSLFTAFNKDFTFITMISALLQASAAIILMNKTYKTQAVEQSILE